MQQFLWKGYKVSKVETQETKVNLILSITWQQVSKFYLVVLEIFSYFIIRFRCSSMINFFYYHLHHYDPTVGFLYKET